ncbi:hypothetical protein FOA52_004335 [Chlamydomonas sp. UWO 241]|nr:hypothetical protein FOA52_004335 [Chlamydomonas sp. UWO 241]
MRCRAAFEDSQNPDEEEDVSALPEKRSKPRLLRSNAPVGGEWGEGFLQFRSDDKRLDVDALNEALQHKGMARLKHRESPDEAFGMIFSFDGVVGNTRHALVRAASQLAEAKGAPPLMPHQQEALGRRSTSTERFFIDVLGWTRDMKTASALAYDLAELYAANLTQLEVMPGMREWIGALSKFSVPCALVTELDRATVQRVLQKMCLHDFFDTLITGDEDFDTISQRLLSASMALRRPPNQCVLFGDCPSEVTAAHNCTMKAVAVCSAYPAYSLKQADLTVGSLSELTVYNMRRLFATQGSEFMDVKQQQNGDDGKRKRRLGLGTMDRPPP